MKGKYIRGQYVPEILVILNDFCSLYCKGKGNSKIYIVSPPYFYNTSYFFKRGNLCRLIFASLRYGLFYSVIRLPFNCKYIRIKNNIRIFGLASAKRKTVKIQGFGYLKTGGEICNEVKMRNLFSNIMSFPVNVPEIFEYNVTSEPKWFVEEYIDGESISIGKHKELIVDLIENQLVSFYKIFLKKKNVCETLNSLGLSLELVSAFWPLQEKERLHYLVKCYWPISICHNDLSFGNLILSNKKLYVLDWEEASKNPVAFDYANLILGNPDLIPSCKRALHLLNKCIQLSGSKLILPIDQLALSLAINSARRRKNRTALIKDRQDLWNRSYNEAASDIDKEFTNRSIIISELLS